MARFNADARASALLLAFENGSNVPLIAGVTDNCKYVAEESLAAVLSTVTGTIEPFALGMQPVNFNFLPPFVTFLVYKAALVVTRGLSVDSSRHDEMRRLRILRKFLRIVAERWLGCREFSIS
jgi:hypothetical protein